MARRLWRALTAWRTGRIFFKPPLFPFKKDLTIYTNFSAIYLAGQLTAHQIYHNVPNAQLYMNITRWSLNMYCRPDAMVIWWVLRVRSLKWLRVSHLMKLQGREECKGWKCHCVCVTVEHVYSVYTTVQYSGSTKTSLPLNCTNKTCLIHHLDVLWKRGTV